MRLGNNNTYLELNNDTVTKLNGNLGVNIESATQPIKIRSNQSADGVQIDAYWGGSTSTAGHPYLHLTPQSSGTGDFVLSSGHGTVRSMSNVGNGRAGIQITDGLSSSWGYFSGVVSGSNNTIIANKDIRSNNGWVYAGNFSFNASKSWQAHGGTYNSTSLEQHLAWLYSLVNSAYNRADSAYTRAGNAQTAAQDGIRRANNAQSRADSAYSLASTANSNANSRVSTSVFNSHRHNLQPNIVVSGSIGNDTIDNIRIVTGINTRFIGRNATTGLPAQKM